MKHLPKHLRPRWRYLAVAIESWPDADIDRETFQQALRTATRTLLGDAESAGVDCSVLSYSHADGTGHAIVRVRRASVEAARAALACLSTVDDHPIGVRVLGVSGTVRACEEKYIGGPLEPVSERHVVFEDVERRAVTRNGRADVRVDGGFIGAAELDFD